MTRCDFCCAALAAVLLVPSLALSQEGTSLESDWLEFVKGDKGDTLGVEVREIEPGEIEDTHTITLAIPKKAIAHPDAIEEVVVVAQAPEKPEPLDVSYEWLDDYDNDNYGLVIRLGSDSNWPIRLYMNSDAGFTR